jgi:PRTRC genetic system protein C
MLTVSKLKRVFVFSGTEVPDPLPGQSPEKCLEVLALSYPHLNNATVESARTEGGKQVYEIKTSYGTKG